ncbi:MAG: hypothetical protein A3C44_01185 [Gammaproteobacteria bacterium RIFCSPHIGHO2_02_FULL_39_13]|nr:MAG: hypothetical protein A3C44_01185 [Gammaproteobacteria bacterium RIFCSPHIGHO2_02_FULL_39_13]OGT49085.1 MAG: hypothetical protein A3E53_06315 [Gammaproteobacteria bacterium RIFCSPHIGHO2_12_FULL_39_24]
MFSAAQDVFALNTTKVAIKNTNYTCQDQKLYFNLVHAKDAPNFRTLLTSVVHAEVNPDIHATNSAPVDTSDSFVTTFLDPSIADATLVASISKKVLTSELVLSCNCNTDSNGSFCAEVLQVIGDATVSGNGTEINPIVVTYQK